jgi:hypothetical protein
MARAGARRIVGSEGSKGAAAPDTPDAAGAEGATVPGTPPPGREKLRASGGPRLRAPHSPPGAPCSAGRASCVGAAG